MIGWRCGWGKDELEFCPGITAAFSSHFASSGMSLPLGRRLFKQTNLLNLQQYAPLGEAAAVEMKLRTRLADEGQGLQPVQEGLW